MLAILFRYIHSRRKTVCFGPYNGRASITGGSGTGNSRTIASRHQSIYDKWLMTRFTIAFIFLS
jgi:hypothetical protein